MMEKKLPFFAIINGLHILIPHLKNWISTFGYKLLINIYDQF